MYDEDLIEDSLAFAKEIKAFLEKQQSTAGQPVPQGQPGTSPVQGQPVASPTQGQPVPGQVRPAGAMPSAQGQPMARPVQGQPIQGQPAARPVQGQPMQGQPTARPVQGQPVPGQVRPAGTVPPAQGQPIARPVQGQPVQGQPAARPVQGQPAARPVQGQPAARPVQGQPMQGQPVARPVQGQPVPGQVRPAGTVPPAQGQPMARPVQGQPVQGQPAARPVQGQPMQGQPVARPVQGQPMQGQPVPGQVRPAGAMPSAQGQPMARPAQGQPMQGQPAARPVQGQPVPGQVRPAGAMPPAQGQPMARPAQGQPVQGQPAARPVQGQPVPGQMRPAGAMPPAQGQPMARPAQGQPMQGQPVARPVQGQPMQGQPMQAQTTQVQSVAGMPSAASPVKKAQPESTVANEAIQKLRAMRQEEAGRSNQVGLQTVPQPEVLQSQAQQPQQVPNQAVKAESQPQSSGEDKNHSYEITIKFDLNNIKKKFKSLKEKLAPEERTLEDINVAMEENRQRLAEGQEQSGEQPEGKNQVAAKAKGIVKNIPKLMKNRQGAEPISADDVDAVDAEIKSLEENGTGGKLAARLEDVREAIPQKASYVSHLATNAIILVLCVGIAYFFASFVTSYVAHQTKVEGESMEPTLSDGDNVIIQKLSYYFKDPSRYDVVVFPVSYDEIEQEDTYYIKRVIGLPGETVQIIDGCVYINGMQLKDDKYALSDILEAGVAADPLSLGENQYFVMGDNRNMSTDSRNSYVGLVNRNDIVGEAWICTWPLSHIGSLKR